MQTAIKIIYNNLKLLVDIILLLDLDKTIKLIIVFIYIYNIVKEAVITTNEVIGIEDLIPFIITSNFKKNIGLGGIPANPMIDKTDISFNNTKELYLILFWTPSKLKIRVDFMSLQTKKNTSQRFVFNSIAKNSQFNLKTDDAAKTFLIFT